MDRKNMVKTIISLLEQVDYSNEEIMIRQLASCNDLIETIALDINKNFKIETPPCEHPKDFLECLNTMGDGKTHLEYKCGLCNEIIKM